MSKCKNAWDFLRFFDANTVCVPRSNKSANAGMDIFQVKTKEHLDSILKTNKTEEKDTYLIINNGGAKLSQITALNAHFIDLDAGRDSKGKYKDPSKVNVFKGKALARIKQFPFTPTAIVETRNGFQVYWALRGGANTIMWNNTQKKIFTFFKDHGADAKVLKANQILRMPATYWFKKYEGKPSFFCRLASFTALRYNEATMQSGLANIKITTVKSANPGIDSDAWKKNYVFDGGYWRPKKVYEKQEERDRLAPSVKPNLPSDISVLYDIADFLTELGQTLYLKGLRDSSKRATQYAHEIRNKFL